MAGFRSFVVNNYDEMSNIRSLVHDSTRRTLSRQAQAKQSPTPFCLGDSPRYFECAGYMVLFTFLLCFCALLAGLTLAIGSLEVTRLHILSRTGDEISRIRALVVARIKRQSNWFLCSVIICSVACMESLPIIIQSAFGNGWAPIVVSTIAITMIAELLPQCFVPRRPLLWGYYSWPVIWGCMWVTCPISWPLGFLVDKFGGSCECLGVYTTEELVALVKYHEQNEKHGGTLGLDASRAARGALGSDGRTLDDFQKRDTVITVVEAENAVRNNSTDAEPSNVELNTKNIGPRLDKGKDRQIDCLDVRSNGMIIPWATVRHVHIDDEVNEDFIAKIREWSYSRIPVLGNAFQYFEDHEDANADLWDGRSIYGFLHIKNLLCVDLSASDPQKKIVVRDLPLYPLPVVRSDVLLYDLLDMFQLGMSRMAIVIHKPPKYRSIPPNVRRMNGNTSPRLSAPLWSAKDGLNAQQSVELKALDAQVDWTTDFLHAEQSGTPMPHHRRQSIIGNTSPNPIGIITFEDIIDNILQKTSLDEKDFVRKDAHQSMKSRKEGDHISVMSVRNVVKAPRLVPAYVTRMQAKLEKGAIRQRLKKGVGMDGADDRDDTPIAVHPPPLQRSDSSYTQNSRGGFHRYTESTEIVHNYIPITSELSADPRASQKNRISDGTRTVSSPPEKTESLYFLSAARTSGRYVSASALPKLRRVTPFTQIDATNETASVGRGTSGTARRISMTEATSNSQCMTEPKVKGACHDHLRASRDDVSRYSWSEHSDAVPLQWYSFEASQLNLNFHQAEEAAQVTKLDVSVGAADDTHSQPTKDVIIYRNSVQALSNGETRTRDHSFHDDRGTLPSQRRVLGRISIDAGRRVSLWF